MKRWIATLLAAAAFGLGTPALHAHTKKSETSDTASIDERAKHFSSLDVAVATATLNAKLLSSLAGKRPGEMDKAIIAASVKNLDLAIAAAREHVGHLKGLENGSVSSVSDLPGSARDTSIHKVSGADDGFARLDDLDRQLRDARSAVKKLKAVKKLANLAGAIDPVMTRLGTVNDTLAAISETWGVARIDLHMGKKD